ncbi:PREDICTED: TATA box-binding protein-associated factor RNA polymerase I subunit A-like [Branchiostoma belcheri]|uniref:TATA box-binding protein-associated factor RNA polymerase I subunit A-like n=1 Tax=Branchiostoma belcheri TaxID=7741 RepID=A0A6P4YJP1_BRABE|nr:PREDICTED: TATA box-binding protein-associated factor RNA polymerase I subunit A-like [Branchiostoma belcheri]
MMETESDGGDEESVFSSTTWTSGGLLDGEEEEEDGTPFYTLISGDSQVETEANKGLQFVSRGNSHQPIHIPLVHLLRRALLQHNWHQAAHVMAALCTEYRDVGHVIWQVGSEVLYNHPGTESVHLQSHADNMEKVVTLNRFQVHLEFIFHLLSKGQLEEAYETIKSGPLRKKGAVYFTKATQPIWVPVVKAYTGLIEYGLWIQGRHKVSQLQDVSGLTGGYDTQESVMLDSTLTTCEETVQRTEEARKVLQGYWEKNPENPNAHKYYYFFLKKHNSPNEQKVKVLKELQKIVPSDGLMLDLVCLKQEEDLGECLHVLFDLLDHHCWSQDIRPWQNLADVLRKIHTIQTPSLLDTLEQCWYIRQDWWPPYHFPPSSAEHMVRSNPALALVKAVVCSLISADRGFSQVVSDLLQPGQRAVVEEAVQIGNAWRRIQDGRRRRSSSSSISSSSHRDRHSTSSSSSSSSSNSSTVGGNHIANRRSSRNSSNSTYSSISSVGSNNSYISNISNSSSLEENVI